MITASCICLALQLCTALLYPKELHKAEITIFISQMMKLWLKECEWLIQGDTLESHFQIRGSNPGVLIFNSVFFPLYYINSRGL